MTLDNVAKSCQMFCWGGNSVHCCANCSVATQIVFASFFKGQQEHVYSSTRCTKGWEKGSCLSKSPQFLNFKYNTTMIHTNMWKFVAWAVRVKKVSSFIHCLHYLYQLSLISLCGWRRLRSQEEFEKLWNISVEIQMWFWNCLFACWDVVPTRWHYVLFPIHWC